MEMTRAITPMTSPKTETMPTADTSRSVGRRRYRQAMRRERLTAAVGTTVFSSIASSPQLWVKILTGIMSMAAAVLAALQTFLKYSERAAQHKAAAQNYGMLRREYEEMQVEAAQRGTAVPPDG